jgi:hypothetical protein
MKKSDLINLIISISLILSVGLSSGFALGYFNGVKASFPEIVQTGEINPGISTIKFLEVKNGYINIKTDGRKTRIAYSPDDIIDLEPNSELKIPINKIDLKNFYVADTLPEGAQYIASSKGKYYYPITDKRAFGIISKNRLYFAKSSEAEEKGYQPVK